MKNLKIEYLGGTHTVIERGKGRYQLVRIIGEYEVEEVYKAKKMRIHQLQQKTSDQLRKEEF